MSFWEDKGAKRPKKECEGVEEASMLSAAVRRKGKVQRPYKVSAWAKDFSLLMKEVEPENLQRVLKWYCAHLGEEFVPVAYSAKAFRAKFAQIELAMQRSLKEEDSPSTELGQKVLQRLHSLRWSGASPESLAQAVEKSLASYVPFYQRCKKYLRETIPKGAYISSDNYFYMLWMRVFRAPEDFVEQWFRARHIALVTWSAWNGSFAKEVFHPEHPRFTFMVRKESINYGATEKRIKELVEKLK